MAMRKYMYEYMQTVAYVSVFYPIKMCIVSADIYSM